MLLPANHPFWEKKIKKEHGTCSKIEGILIRNFAFNFIFMTYYTNLINADFVCLDLNNMPVQDMLVHLHNDMFSHINQILVNGGLANSSNEERNN